MAHRKPRPARPGIRTPALATAALTSVALLSQTANAAPSTDDKPSLEEVEKKVEDLYRGAETVTGKYNSVKEQTSQQKKRVDTLLDDVAKRTEKLNEAREELGEFAAAQYRTGAASPDAALLLLAENPEEYFTQNQLTDRLTERQQTAVDDYVTRRADAAKQRQEATESFEQLTDSQNALKTNKAKVQRKLAQARELLSELAAEEKARLAAIEKREQEEADRKAEELAQQQAAAQEAQQTQKTSQAPQPQESQETQQSQEVPQFQETRPQEATSTAVEDSTYASKAAKALTFARSQVGKPYVWGATGPGSYDCSGFTQAAWKAAGVGLPRTTYDQVHAGTTVSFSAAKPGDLIFFYNSIGHVGIYIGNGMMIHAPKPGTYVREESVFYDGEGSIHSMVRPA